MPDRLGAAARAITSVAEDEPLARRKLLALIAELPWAENIGEAADGCAAAEAVDRLRPDLLFLDVRMPELSGLDVLRRLTHAPAVVFTTAHGEFAVAAFELAAVDHLLKPFGRERFRGAAERARAVLDGRRQGAALAQARVAPASPGATLDRVLARDGRGGIVPIPVGEIVRAEAQDDYVAVHARGREHLLGVRVAELEARLPRPPFLRVHRSHTVNLDRVERMVPLDDGRLVVVMRDGTRVPASRPQAALLRRGNGWR